MKFEKLQAIVAARCVAALEERGVRQVAGGAQEISLSQRMTGAVGLAVKKLAGAHGLAVLVFPSVAVRDGEVGRLVAGLRGLPEGDPEAQPRYVVTRELSTLIPERGTLPHEWVAAGKEDADQVARKIADDVVFAGFPYMQALASPDAYFEEFKQAPRRAAWPRESAVTYMMHGDLENARRMLWRLARPLSQNPAVWDDNQAAAVSFFAAFESHFGVDLGIGDWPVREQPVVRPAEIKIRDGGVIPAALKVVGRSDLAERGAALSEAEIKQICSRASEILADSSPTDPDRAVGLAAVEFLTSRGSR